MQKSVQVRTPLYAAAYWQQAADEFKNIRVLAFAGMVTALAIILESFPIYLLGQSLKIYFSFVVVSLSAFQLWRAVFPRLSDYGHVVRPDLRRYALPAQTHHPTPDRDPSADQLRQQCAAGQCVESYVVWQGLPVLPEHRHGQKHHHDPH